MSRDNTDLRFHICTTSSMPVSLHRYLELADGLGADGLDIDGTSWIGRRCLRRRLAIATAESPVPVCSLWLNPGEITAFVAQRDRSGHSNATKRLDDAFDSTIVVRVPDGARAPDFPAIISSARGAVQAAGVPYHLTLATHALATDGGRAHLHRLQILRRLTEEWDMDLALDLSELTDSRWEAEAAIQIIGKRLTILRIRGSQFDHTAPYVEVHRRTLRACADSDYRGIVSLVPTTPWWLTWHRPAVRADLTANYDMVARLLLERRMSHRQQGRLSLH